MILIFTGNGKGKTTASLGQAVRALGNGKKVLMIQFIKGPWESGEHSFVKNFMIHDSSFVIHRAGKGFVKILGDKLPLSEHKKAAAKGLELAQKAINPPAGGKKYDLIILDEINNAVNLKLIKVTDVLRIIKPLCYSEHSNEFVDLNRVDVILTGRNAPKSFIKIADIVTEMKEIKHIFNNNKHSMKKGIEY